MDFGRVLLRAIVNSIVDLVVSKGASRGIAPGSNECGKFQPLRALCLFLSRYRLNRLLFLCGDAIYFSHYVAARTRTNTIPYGTEASAAG